jgi:patatin-like phospholipase/acyl hydrolase
MPEKVAIRIHPPTSGVGVLCIDGGGIRGILPLRIMKRIQDRVGLSVPFQSLFKVAFGISTGELLILHRIC